MSFKIPKNRAQALSVYGDPSNEIAIKRNLKIAAGLPGIWNGGRGRLYVHRLAEAPLRAALLAL